MGAAADHVLAFSRGDGNLVTAVTRFPMGLEQSGGWRDTSLPLEGAWTDVLTGRDFSSFAVSGLFAEYPVALLVRSGQ
jgi:(1->4)-alpha-D-glucan 1-alpha-D-glucosylmutase